MAFLSRKLQCQACDTTFAYSDSEQGFRAEVGMDDPVLCESCSRLRYSGGKQSDLRCSSCGNPLDIPIQPRGDSDLFCSHCLDKRFGVTGTYDELIDFNMHHVERPYYDIHGPEMQ